MAFIGPQDRVLEVTTTAGSGALTLGGAVVGFRPFSAVCGVGDTLNYFIESLDSVGQPTGDYEYGLGTYSAANTLTRTTVLGSSNAGATVNFAAGSKNVGIGLLASSITGGSNANGRWRKHPDGSIEQWGSAVSSAGGAAAVTYPIPFPTGAGALVLTPIAGSAGMGTQETGSTTGFTFSVWNTSGTRVGVSTSWMAKGT